MKERLVARRRDLGEVRENREGRIERARRENGGWKKFFHPLSLMRTHMHDGARGEKVRKGEKIFSPSYAHACEHEKRE